MLDYHDREWGVPLHGERELFGKLVLDGFQAGLSWSIILNKRARFLEAFEGSIRSAWRATTGAGSRRS